MNESEQRLQGFLDAARQQDAQNIGAQVFKAAEVSSDQQFAIEQDSERLAYSAEEAADAVAAAKNEDVEGQVFSGSGLQADKPGEPGGDRSVIVENDKTLSVLGVEDWKAKEATHVVDNTEWTINSETGNDALTGTSTTRELVLDESGVAQGVNTTREIYDGTGNKSVYATESTNPDYTQKVQRRIAKETDQATSEANVIVSDYKSGVLPKEIPTK